MNYFKNDNTVCTRSNRLIFFTLLFCFTYAFVGYWLVHVQNCFEIPALPSEPFMGITIEIKEKRNPEINNNSDFHFTELS